MKNIWINQSILKRVETSDEGFEDAFQYIVAGQGHNRLKSTNLLERLNQEVRRREKVIRIFPNHASANRLIGAVLMNKSEENGSVPQENIFRIIRLIKKSCIFIGPIRSEYKIFLLIKSAQRVG